MRPSGPKANIVNTKYRNKQCSGFKVNIVLFGFLASILNLTEANIKADDVYDDHNGSDLKFNDYEKTAGVKDRFKVTKKDYIKETIIRVPSHDVDINAYLNGIGDGAGLDEEVASAEVRRGALQGVVDGEGEVSVYCAGFRPQCQCSGAGTELTCNASGMREVPSGLPSTLLKFSTMKLIILVLTVLAASNAALVSIPGSRSILEAPQPEADYLPVFFRDGAVAPIPAEIPAQDPAYAPAAAQSPLVQLILNLQTNRASAPEPLSLPSMAY